MKASPLNRRYGWIRDLPDPRDIKYNLSGPVLLPETVDLRPTMPPIYEQGSLGSCTANALASVMEFNLIKERNLSFMPSRLFIYYNERAIEGTTAYDAGAMIRDGIKSLATQGACSEASWPYTISRFTEKPNQLCYTDALLYRTIKYFSVPQSETEIKSILAAGFPVVFGFTVFSSFETQEVARTGVAVMPDIQSDTMLGGHAVVIVGYIPGFYIVRNSWGNLWGQHGYFLMPLSYVHNKNLASDFWTIELVR